MGGWEGKKKCLVALTVERREEGEGEGSNREAGGHVVDGGREQGRDGWAEKKAKRPCKARAMSSETVQLFHSPSVFIRLIKTPKHN